MKKKIKQTKEIKYEAQEKVETKAPPLTKELKYRRS